MTSANSMDRLWTRPRGTDRVQYRLEQICECKMLIFLTAHTLIPKEIKEKLCHEQ